MLKRRIPGTFQTPHHTYNSIVACVRDQDTPSSVLRIIDDVVAVDNLITARKQAICIAMGCTASIIAVLLLVLGVLKHSNAAPDETLQCIDIAPCYLKCGGTCSTSARSAFGVRGTGRVTSERAQAAGSSSMRSMLDVINTITDVAEQQAQTTVHKLRPNEYPDSTDPVTGEWKVTVPGRWTSG